MLFRSGTQAVKDAGVLVGYRGVIVHDRLALYWQFTRAKHQVCTAHLLRDLASVAAKATAKASASASAIPKIIDKFKTRTASENPCGALKY